MRIFIRDNILEMLITLLDAIRYAAGGGEQSNEVLGDCVDAIRSIEDTLVANLSSERAAFYGGLTAKIRNCVNDLSPHSIPLDEAEQRIRSLYEELSNESEVKLEIAFFPYKASMWDSLESVWLAAKDDPRCNAVVVPIPYYDKLPNGDFGQLYYEGGDFPDYVPIIGFDNYDPSVMRPDIAYIHNPYDQSNYVSSVDPRWYSGELKEHVGCLVYVPYYVNMWASAAHMSAAAMQGGADIIIAHNELDAGSYMAHGVAKDIAALGSPKLDRVLQVCEEKPAIPDKWKPLLAGKKIFLLVTTVSTVLQFGDFGEKLRRIIAYFENRKDIALIWRPHPLERSTVSSMRPGQLDGYTRLLKSVSESGVCVVDNSPDVTAAIALADAYIGDGNSSVTYMFKTTGKPVYVVDFDNTEVLTEDYEEALRAEYLSSPAVDEDYLWGACVNYNGLAKLDTRDGSMEYIGEIPGESLTGRRLFSSVRKVGDKLILVPLVASSIAEYDIPTGTFNMIPLPDAARADSGKPALGGTIEYGDYLYIIPRRSRAFARYNKITDEYEFFYDWYEDFEQYITSEEREFFSGAALIGDALYLGSRQNNIICELSLKTLRLKVHRVGQPHYRFHALLHDRKYLWMTRFVDAKQPDRRDSVVRWDYRYGKLKEFGGFPVGFKMHKGCYTHLSVLTDCGEYILALPFHGNMLVRIDKASGHMTRYDTGLGIDFRERKSPIYSSGSFAMTYRLNSDTLLLTSMYDYSLLRIDLKSGKTKKYKQRFKGDSHMKAATSPEHFKHNYVFHENLLFRPGNFIEECLEGNILPFDARQAEYYRSFVENPDGSCGAKVHEYVMAAYLSES